MEHAAPRDRCPETQERRRAPGQRRWTARRRFALLIVGLLPLACRGPAPELVRVVPQVGVAQPRRLQFSPVDSHRLLVMEATGLVSIWDVTDPKQPHLFASIRASATDARFSPDGQSIATVGIDGHVRWWSPDGTLRWTSAGRHEGWARAVTVAPNRIVTGGEDEKIRFWTHDGVADGEPLQAHPGSVLSIDVAPNGDLVSLGSDEVVRLWKAGAHGTYTEQVLYREPAPRHTRMLYSLLRLDVQWGWDRAVRFSPRGDTIAVAMFDGAIRLFNGDATPRQVIAKAHDGHHVRVIDFSADGAWLASVGFNGRVQLWHADGTPKGRALDVHRGPALGVAISPDGKWVASAGVDDLLRFWTDSGVPMGELPRPYADRIRSFSMAPQSRVFACGDGGGAVSLWNLDGSPHGKPLPGHRGAAEAVAFSRREDLLVTGGKDQTVRLSTRDGQSLAAPFTGHIDGVIAVAVSPDGNLVVSGSRNDVVRVWRRDGKPLHMLTGLRDMITDIVFSPDGTFFAAADAPGELMMWNNDGSVRTNVFKAHMGLLSSVAFSPDGSFIATGGYDNLVKLWHLDGTERAAPLAGHLAPVQSVAFAPDSRTLASGSSDGTVRLWDLATRDARVLFVGLPINQLGFIGNQMWVRANGETLLLYDKALELRATLVWRRDAVLSFTPDGWFFGPPDAARAVRVYGADGQPLDGTATAARFSRDRLVAAVAGR